MAKPGANRQGADDRRRSPWLAPPWPALSPWLVMLAGLCIGGWIGYTPQLLVALAATCLGVSWLRSR